MKAMSISAARSMSAARIPADMPGFLTASVRVDFGDLNLARASDRAALTARVAAAVEALSDHEETMQ